MTNFVTLQNVGNGLAANDGTGDPLRTGAGIFNTNHQATATAINRLAAAQAGGSISFLTKVDMDANLNYPDGTIAWVTNDPVATNNKAWRKNGLTGSGDWTETVDRIATIVGNGGGYQAGAGTPVRTLQDKMRDTKSIIDFGGRGDGLVDNTAAINAARTAGVVRLLFPTGVYCINGQVDFTGMSLEGDGHETVLDCAGATVNYPLTAHGALNVLPSATAIGINTITFSSNPGLQVGDAINIHNPTAGSFNPARAYYYAGEWAEVLAVNSNTVTLRNPLYDSYTPAGVNVYALDGKTAAVINCTIKASIISTGIILAQMLRSPKFEGVKIQAHNVSGVFIDRCFGSEISLCSSSNDGAGASTNPYCITIGNSQHVRIYGGIHYSKWQPLSIGGLDGVGAVPNRDIVIDGAIVRNDPASGVVAADIHGNSKDVRHINCTIYNGATFSGGGSTLDNCDIFGHLTSGFAVYGSEIVGGTFTVRNCRIKTYADPFVVNRGVIDIGGNSNAITSGTTKDCYFIVQNNRIDVGSSTADVTSVVRIVNRGTAKKINVCVSDNYISMPTTGYMFNMQMVSGSAASDGIVVERNTGMPTGMFLCGLDVNYLGMPLRLQRQSGYVSGTTDASSSWVSIITAFKYKYPRIPRTTCMLTGAGGVATAKLGGQVGVPGMYQVTPLICRPMVQATANFASGAALELHWTAEINEC